MLPTPKQAALEVSAGSASSIRPWTDQVEGSPVKSRLVPSDCRSVTKPIYPRNLLRIVIDDVANGVQHVDDDRNHPQRQRLAQTVVFRPLISV